MDKNIYVRIEFNSDILGSGVFWDDHSDYLPECSNLAAKLTAQRALEENTAFTFGMWTATPYQKRSDKD